MPDELRAAAAPGAAHVSVRERVFVAVRALASLRLTLLILASLAVGVLVSYHQDQARTWPLVVPLGMLAANLAAAVATNAVFRRQVPLLVFHLALIALVTLVAAGRLSYLKGQLELTEGEEFEGRLTQHEAGPLHGWDILGLRFVNEGFTIAYAPGVRRGPTANQVAWQDGRGAVQRAVIGDHDPLVLAGYRFYTSHNKGFAPTFEWRPKGGQASVGAVHLPSFPLHEYRQAQEWTPPGSRVPVWVMLQFDEEVLDPERAWEFRLPSRHTLVVRVGESRHELKPGESLELPDGRLGYLGLRAWMGYTVFYDWTLPWLLATVIVAVASLGWHFWSKFARKPWDV
jgi:cytochrome c biogenesis protein